MTVELETISLGNGGVVVLTPEWRVRAAVASLRKQAALIEETESRARIEQQAESLLQTSAAIRREHADRIEVRRYAMRPYTYGEKLRAERESISWVEGQSVPDLRMYEVRLIAAGLEASEEDVLGMPPPIVAALSRELHDMSEPDPEKLDFFVSSLTGSGAATTGPTTESASNPRS